MTTAINVENLGKAYRIGLKEEIPDTLVSAMASWAKMPLRNFRRLSRLNTFGDNGESEDTVWALRDVSFEVQEGDVVGVIGRNGAGKSTLLKILSRITEPTSGRAVIHGRVSSLLEVGTGFHPELSGRENIYMNGTILGMTKREIDRKFDEIVEFSGVEKFLDTPIKRYSSGMKVRLAFSVAAHLEPEILVIDEVLAVGDAEFQRKCLGKMHDVAAAGRTVLFVSHNLGAVSSLCNRAIFLDAGRLRYSGRVDDAIEEYLGMAGHADAQEWIGRHGDDLITMSHTWVRSLAEDGSFHTAADLEVGVEIDVHREFEGLIVGFRLYSEFEYPLAYVLFDDRESGPPPRVRPGSYTKRFIIPANSLASGQYRVGFEIGQARIKAVVLDTPGELTFELLNVAGLGRRYPMQRKRGFNSLFRPSWSAS